MNRKIRDIEGAAFLIQSPTKGCSHMIESLNNHLESMRASVRNMTDVEFETIVNTVNINISQKDKNMQEEFTKYWNELTSHSYRFNRQAQMIEKF